MKVFTSLFIFSLIYGSNHGRSIEDAKHGCAAPFALPNLPYFVVWNIPSGGCEASGIDLNLTAYGIVTNKDDKFFGENMNIFYGIGPLPYFGKNHTAINGGLPQNGNLTEYLAAVKQNVEKYIPDPEFSGLAVMDWEVWYPHLQLNYDANHVYVTESIALVKKQHPTWTDENLIVAEATRQFDSATRAYMQETLETIRYLRPKGHWGFYSYPRCWGATANMCGPSTPFNNDAYMGWLFSLSTGLFPRIYTHRYTPLEDRFLFIRRTVNETLRVQARWSGLNTPIMPYSCDQDNATDFFQKEDLQIAITEPADFGASGVVIWGSSGYFHTPNECKLMRDNIKNNLGPFVKNLTDFASACARDLCNNHGRCVRKDYEATTQEFLRLYDKKSCVRPMEEYENISNRRRRLFDESIYRNLKKYDNNVCRCLAGWHGEYCDKPAF